MLKLVRRSQFFLPDHMVDIVDAATRSRLMSGIRGKNTRPEIRVRQVLHRQGFRFRLNVAGMPGKPDIVLRRFNAVILVHGCFWHGHGCRLFKWPATRPEFWRQKIGQNKLNDRKTALALRESGWRIATVWECAMRGVACMDDDTLGVLLADWLHGDKTEIELPVITGAES